jgi:hypothetical protein
MELKLYELPEQYEKIMNLDVDEETLQLILKSLNQTLEVKATNIARVTRTMDAGINAIKNEENRLKGKRKALENRLDKLKQYLFDNMKAMDIQKVSTDTDTIYISGRDYSKIVNRDKLPDEYKQQVIDVKIDKRKLNKDIKTKDIAGVEVEHKEWIVIK